MSPPSALHRSSGCVSALAPNLKVFLSGSVLFFGTVGTLPFYQPSRLPSSSLPNEQSVLQLAVAEISNEITPPLPIVEPKDGSSMFSFPSVPAPSVVAVQSEKYAQAYPEPILTFETPIPADVPQTSKGNDLSPTKASSAPFREFATIHQFAPVKATSLNRQVATFDKQPECVDPSKLVDSLLPMLHFAENLKPLSQDSIAETPPENPFLSPDVQEERKLSPLQPYLELRPLRLPEKKHPDQKN